VIEAVPSHPRSVFEAPPSAARVVGIVLMSVGTHLGILGALGFMPSPAQFFARHPVEMEVIEPAPPPPPPPATPEPPKPPEPEPEKPRAAPKPVVVKAAPAPTPEPPKEAPPPAEAPVDFGGVTLTADGSSWATQTGNGQQLQGPVGRIGKVTGKDKEGAPAAPAPPAVVAEGSLSRKPVPPPDMNDLLEKNFPPRARAQGVSGTARLRVRILADGRTGEMTLIHETGDYGFGDACIKTLRMRRWQAPLDRQGNPVATDVKYTCDFEVGY
jgi:protein TonB